MIQWKESGASMLTPRKATLVNILKKTAGHMLTTLMTKRQECLFPSTVHGVVSGHSSNLKTSKSTIQNGGQPLTL